MNNESWCKENCPYYPDCGGGGVCNTVLALLKEQENNIDTLKTLILGYESGSLLKEQEPVKPRYTPPKSIYSWECGVCAEPFDRIANYCPKCGRRVKWE